MKVFPTDVNQLPVGGVCYDVTTQDGVRLRSVAVRQARAKATVIILGGRAEYVERYFETVNDLSARGMAVVCFDWRGQGGSQRLLANPLRGYVKSFADYDKDLEAIIGLAQRLDYPKPYYALAHSTGGQVLLRALRDKNWFARAVISAPLMDFRYGRWPLPVVRVLNFLMVVFGFGWVFLPGYGRGPLRRDEFENNPLTSDRGRWNRDMETLEMAPQLGIGGPTYGWLRAAMKSFDDLRRWPRGKGPVCPTMIVAAGQDRVVDTAATREFVGRVPGFTFLTIDDSRHEILMENNMIRAKFFAAFDTFLGLTKD